MIVSFILLIGSLLCFANPSLSTEPPFTSFEKSVDFSLEEETPDEPDEPDDPYIVYDFDENSNFAGAIQTYFNSTCYGLYHDLGDVDYYSISSVSSLTYLTFSTSISSDIALYKKINSTYYQTMSVSSVTTNDLFILEPGLDYYFEISSHSVYTGQYSFSYSSMTINTGNYYIHVIYNPITFLFVRYELIQRDYSSLPNKDANFFAYPNPNNATEVSTGSTGGSNSTYQFYNDWVPYTSGIYDISGTLSYEHGPYPNDRNINVADDDRLALPNGTYPKIATAFIWGNEREGNNWIRGSSFFIKDDLAMTAAHMVFHIHNGGQWTQEYRLLPGFDSSIDHNNEVFSPEEFTITRGSYGVIGSYIPLNYLSCLYGETGGKRDYDWAILRTVEITPPQTGCERGYLGIAHDYYYPSYEYTSIGYPGCFYYDPISHSSSRPMIVSCLSNKGQVLLCGDDNRQFCSTHIDISEGDSGGPLVGTYYGYVYAVGIVSGYDADHGNCFTRISKNAYGLIQELAS